MINIRTSKLNFLKKATGEHLSMDEKRELIEQRHIEMREILSKPPVTKEDWKTFEYASQDNPGRNIKFGRNGAEVKIKKGKIKFMKDGYFKTGPFSVKLEQNKLIINFENNLEKLTMITDEKTLMGTKN